ncbi:MAG: hypothetical protein JW744_05520 [Candidatus Diapherotrites archaeon]|uniref:Uncharacterized protein n=1 Tax=Candidatus Iainarchaeum sp. TaxID=3101447 RepID=A0A938YS27_9ARCH|nr:hypothetical protein [Candidatus Diapherotrites archaeon]
MRMVEAHEIRDVLLSVDWALISFFLVRHTPFDLVSANLIKNIGGIALFAGFVIAFELFGKGLIWVVVGKHHRIGKQILALIAILGVLALIFTLVA